MAAGRLELLALCFVGLAVSGRAFFLQVEGLPPGDVGPQVDPSLRDVFPIEWVHVPKTGSSFLQTLLHIPGVCPGLPSNSDALNSFIASFTIDPSWQCNASAVDLAYGRVEHAGIESLPKGGFAAGKGRFMMMMRQPEQRLLSHYYHYDTTPLGWAYVGGFGIVGWDDFVASVSGCVTKMLTRAAPREACLSSTLPPTSAEVEEAKVRLRTGFAFVGLTEEWGLSMCLFNAMFSQPCRSYQFANMRATFGGERSLYNTSRLQGYRDPYDSDLYDIGRGIFEASLKKYKVTESSCTACLREAGALANS